MTDAVVTTGSGKLRGIIRRADVDTYNYFAFLGIPYAEPPTGELRFKDPIPVSKWANVREATQHGSCCSQLASFFDGKLKGSDDCLYLNVYTRNLENNGVKKATMVWIHGGAFIEESGGEDWYGPEFLLRKDIVLVTINYRLGILGFLNLDDEVASGNQGLKDMVLALEWVKENIGNFGGDPNNVTIFGESAGGAATHYLTISPLARGLFHKAIAQSGSANAPWAFLDDPKSFALKLSKHLGCNSQNPQEILDFLKKIDCHKLVEAQNLIRTKEEKVAGIFSFVPSIDNKSKRPFLPKHPVEMAKNGVSVPLMLGYTNSEGLIMVPNPDDARPQELITLGCKFEELDKIEKTFEKYLNPRWVESMRKNYGLGPQDIKKLYFGDQQISGNTLQQWADFNSDTLFIGSIHELVEHQVKQKSTSTFLYLLTYEGERSLKSIINVKLPGVCHGDDLGYLFSISDGQAPIDKNSKDWKVMDQMTELWTNFAKTGNPTPNTSDLLPCIWQPVTDSVNFNNLNIGDQLKMETMRNIKKKYGNVK